MTDQSSPITPPPELVQQLYGLPSRMRAIELAYQAGADQELEACCHVIETQYGSGSRLRAARRPKPSILKERALEELEQLRGDANSMGMGFDAPAIRRALEALPND